MSDCLRSTRIYGPCHGGLGVTGAHSTGDVGHIVGDLVYCSACCSVCNPKGSRSDEWMANLGAQDVIKEEAMEAGE